MPRPSTEVNGLGNLALPLVKRNDQEKFVGRWKNFEGCFNGLSEFSSYISAWEENIDKGKRLESELLKKTAEVSSYADGRRQMLEGFAEAYKTWKEKESRLVGDLRNANNEISSLQAQLAGLKEDSVSNEIFHRRLQEMERQASRRVAEVEKKKAAEAQSLQKAMNGLEKKLKKVEADLADKSTFLIGSEMQLKSCRSELEKREKEIGLEELSADFGPTLMKLSMSFHHFARECFFTTLPKELDADDLFIKLQCSRFFNTISRAIPISNTEASKHLRTAAAESIIAKNLTEKLLQPLHVIDFAAKDQLEGISDRLFRESPRRESIFRSLLLVAYAPQRQVQEAKILNTVLEEAGSLLAPLLFSPADVKAFKTGLDALLHEAMELWGHAQKSSERILASTEDSGGEWGFHDEHDTAVALTPAQTALVLSSEKPLMTLFPQVYSLEPSTVWHKGFSLWSNQSVVIAGDLESKEQVDRVNSRNGKSTGGSGKRKSSISTSTGNLSFHQRTKSQPISMSSPRVENGSFPESVR